jgi:hypothetical protein
MIQQGKHSTITHDHRGELLKGLVGAWHFPIVYQSYIAIGIIRVTYIAGISVYISSCHLQYDINFLVKDYQQQKHDANDDKQRPVLHHLVAFMIC